MTPPSASAALPDGARPLQRGDLTKRMILDTALRLVDTHGLEAVTIRRIADELGVSPMGLYRHIRTKEEILDGLGALARDILASPVDQNARWDDQLRQVFLHMHRVLLAHPGVVQVLLTQPASDVAVYRTVDQLLGSLQEAGFTAAESLQEIATLESYTLGFTVQQRSHAGQNPNQERARLEKLPSHEFPNLSSAADMFATWASEERFTTGLDISIDRLRRERRRKRTRRSAAARA